MALKNINFVINPKDKIGLVGRTGAGKSTVGLALSRIIELFRGQIIIDGQDISRVPLDILRKRITIIPQDPTLFKGTLRFNLDPENDVRDHEIFSVLKKANLLKIVQQEQLGLYQEISEGGQNFSSGERQLICVCRAILRKSKLILLDEATASIDLSTEKLIQDLMQKEFEDSTTITIAHRLNTVLSCDKVMVLSFGRLVEYDTP